MFVNEVIRRETYEVILVYVADDIGLKPDQAWKEITAWQNKMKCNICHLYRCRL